MTLLTARGGCLGGRPVGRWKLWAGRLACEWSPKGEGATDPTQASARPTPCGQERPGSWGPCFCLQGTPENPGINQRALQLLFSEVQEKASDWEYTITVSAAEIYNEVLRWEALPGAWASRVALSGPCGSCRMKIGVGAPCPTSAQGCSGPSRAGSREEGSLRVYLGHPDQTWMLLSLPSPPVLSVGYTRWREMRVGIWGALPTRAQLTVRAGVAPPQDFWGTFNLCPSVDCVQGRS